MKPFKNKTQKSITILWGLPGSGKTSYANQQSASKVFDYDKAFLTYGTEKARVKCVNSIKTSGKYNQCIIDCLITLNQEARNLIDYLTNNLSDKYDLVFKIVWFEEDRASSLINDKNRRPISSETAIKHMVFESPDPNLFPEISQKRLIKMKTYQKTDLEIWVDGLSQDIRKSIANMELTSSYWSKGGSYGNCWNSEQTMINAEDSLEFDLFDDLLIQINPNISYLQYKKIFGASCSIQETFETDYYGGGTTRAHHKCDLYKLYNVLKELKLINI